MGYNSTKVFLMLSKDHDLDATFNTMIDDGVSQYEALEMIYNVYIQPSQMHTNLYDMVYSTKR